MRSLQYRPALDGVRALAVLSVIAYHFRGLAGGFLGVDVFFVLSGYLITTLLLHERATTGRIRLPAFWARRARRLFPALLLLLVAAAVVIGQSAPATALTARRSDIFATLFYYANWHFIATSQSYFAAYTGISPLLHTWSLAIEEQFYLVWPLLLLGLVRLTHSRRQIRPWIILTGALLSVIEMAVLYKSVDPYRSFFGTDTRAHALLIGAALATLIYVRPSVLTHSRARTLATSAWPVVGLPLALAGLTIADQSSFYYHGGSGLVAIATATGLWILESAPQGFPARVLSLPPLRWVGRISYGLYLWHWPLIVWLGGSYTLSTRLGAPWVGILELGSTFAIAAASFYLLEQPVRSGRFPWLGISGTRLAGAVAILTVIVVSLTLSVTAIGPGLASAVNDVSDSSCPAHSPGIHGFTWCSRTQPATSTSPVVAVIGDSTAGALNPGMREAAMSHGWRYIQAYVAGCSVLPLVLPIPNDPQLAFRRLCTHYVPMMLAQITRAYHPNVWIISDRFPIDALALPDGRLLAPGDPRRDHTVEASMHRVFARLVSSGAQVVVVAMPPRGQPLECGTQEPPASSCDSREFTTADQPTRILDRLNRQAVAQTSGKIAYVSVDDVLCPDNGRCPPVIQGSVARYDGVHYTSAFSRMIVPVIIARAERAGISWR